MEKRNTRKESFGDFNLQSTAPNPSIYQANVLLYDLSSTDTSQCAIANAVMNVLKTCHQNAHKYSAAMDDNFVTKYALFSERCDQAFLSQQDRHLAFSAMLTRPALNFFSRISKTTAKLSMKWRRGFVNVSLRRRPFSL